MTHQQQTAFENTVGKGEIARNEQFLLFPQYFLLNQIIVSPFVHIFAIIFLFAAEFEEPEIGISGKALADPENNTRFTHTYISISDLLIHQLFTKQQNFGGVQSIHRKQIECSSLSRRLKKPWWGKQENYGSFQSLISRDICKKRIIL